jgi:hypothetical protein
MCWGLIEREGRREEEERRWPRYPVTGAQQVSLTRRETLASCRGDAPWRSEVRGANQDNKKHVLGSHEGSASGTFEPNCGKFIATGLLVPFTACGSSFDMAAVATAQATRS